MNGTLNLPALFPSGTALMMLGLALMIGGMLALGAFTAPVLFKAFPRPDAGAAMTLIFRRFDTVLMVALGMVLLGEVFRVVAAGLPAWNVLSLVRYGVLGLLSVLMLVSLFSINPQIESMYNQGVTHGGTEEGQRFTKTHRLSEKLYKVELMAAALLLILTPFVQRAP